MVVGTDHFVFFLAICRYRDPGMMSKWQYINAFVPRTHPLVENVTSSVFQNAFITADPGYSPPLQPLSAPIVDPGPDAIISIHPTIPRSQPQSQYDTTNCLSASPNTDDALTWKLSANAKARLLYKSCPFYQNVMALTVPQYGRCKSGLPFMHDLSSINSVCGYPSNLISFFFFFSMTLSLSIL